MSVYIDVWHRTHPLTPGAHQRFLDYYGEFVVAPPSDYFEVIGGFVYLDGDSNSDFALYRYASMAQIEESMMHFGADERFVTASEALFAEIEIEETRGVAIYAPYASDERIDAIAAEKPDRDRRYVRIARRLPALAMPAAGTLLAAVAADVEKMTEARLVTSFTYLVGPVTESVELWVLSEGQEVLARVPAGTDAALRSELDRFVPETERRLLAPTAFSRLR